MMPLVTTFTGGVVMQRDTRNIQVLSARKKHKWIRVSHLGLIVVIIMN